MIVIILITLATLIVYYLLKQNYQHWEKKGVKGPTPSLLVGNLGRGFLMLTSPGEIYSDAYKQFPEEEIVGMYRATTPIVLARDPEFIKEVIVKSFSSFHDNDIEIDKKNDPLWGRNPFVLKGEEWKIARALLTPAFTSGKMKWLYPPLEEVSLDLVKFIEKTPEATNGEGFEAKELCTRFTLNNVASCAFGLQGKCFQEKDSNFRQLAREFLSPGGYAIVAFFLMMMYPPISKIFRLRLITKSVEKKLVNMISQTLKYREDNNIVRNDFLHIMMQLKKSCKDFEFTDVDVAAHAAGFFGDGFESSSIVMSFTLFELAANPEVQDILRQKVLEAFEGKDKISHDNLVNLAYLDAIINEAMRLHPILFFLQKQCTKDFTYVLKSTQKPIVIEKGTPVIIPLHGLHLDPKYFENPQLFNPERFLDKDSLTKYTFLPFGEGPRACLGQRFGLLQLKAGLAYVIKNYEVSVNQKTQLPIKYLVSNALTSPVGGLWLDFKKL